MATSQMSEVLEHLRRAALLRDGAGLTDGQLLEGFVSRREQAALAALVQRHGPMVWGVCRRVLANHHDAEDAFQATFLVLVRKAASIVPREMVVSWLYGVAHQTALKARATTAKRRARERHVKEMPQPAMAQQGLWNDLQELLDQELNCLPAKYRVVILLCDLEGKTRKEAARQLGLPEGTVAGRLARARALLAKRLARHGLAASGGALAAVLAQHAARAAVPASVLSSTIGVANLLAAGPMAAGIVSARVASLTKGVMKAMFMSRLRIIAALVVGVGVVAGGMVAQQPMLVYQSSERQPPEAGSKGKNLQGTGKEAKEPGAPRILELDWRGRRVAWSPDGKTLAVVTKNESLLSRRGSAVKLWDVEKGEVRDTLAESGDPGLAFQHLVFSRNGKTIAATVSEGPPGVDVVKLWDAQTLALKQTLRGHSQLVCVALSPDGKLVAAGDPGKKSLRLWSADTGTLERTLETGEASPWSMAFSPDSKTLVVGGQKNDGSGEVSLWDAETGKLKHTLKQEKYVAAVAFAPNGKMVASAGGSGEVRLWDLQKGELVMAVPGLKSGTRSVAFSPDSKTVAAPGSDNRIRVWDVQTGKLQETLEGHEAEIYSIAFSPDGKTLASVSQDQTLRLWPIGKRAALAK